MPIDEEPPVDVPAVLPEGRCDLHCHLLHGVDDGARTLDDSLAMARALVALGYGSVAPSPHARGEHAPLALARSRLVEVQQALSAAGIPLRLFPNGENFLLEDGFFDAAPGATRRLLGHGPYLLVEAPYQAPVPVIREMVFRLKLQGVIPLFAHPERCQEFGRPGRARELVEAGALLQLDVGALNARYGHGARRLALELLEQGLYAVAATDLHSPHDAEKWVGAALRELESLAGPDALLRLTDTHPKRLLRGEPLEQGG